MSMDMLASLLQDLLKEVRALRARAEAEALPRVLKPRAAAKLLGCSLKALQDEIRRGRIQTVEVGGEEHVPMSEVIRLTSLRAVEAAEAKRPAARRKAPTKPPGPTQGGKRKGRRRRDQKA